METIVMGDEKLPFQSLKCPSCGNRMEKGYVTLISGYASALFFSEKKGFLGFDVYPASGDI